MKTHQRGLPVISTAFLFMLLVIIWINFAPTQMGGQASYIIVDGNSMQPDFQLGDLVILRKPSNYQVGDVATYNNSEMGGLVIHRIIAVEQDRFVFKGDNNTWVDAYIPTQAELVGKLWAHIPKIGMLIQWVRIPINTALTACLLGGILMTSLLAQPSRHNKKTAPKGNSFEWLFYLFGFPALIFLALSIFAATLPLFRNAGNIIYRQEGIFYYSASGTPGIYDTDTVHSGEPVFPALTCSLNLGFSYNLAGEQSGNISGSQQLYARVLDEQSGWQRTIPLNGETAFNGSSYSTNATLDLCQVEALVAGVEQKTGFHPNTYTLDVISHTSVTGKLAGQEFRDSFEPKLRFRFDKLHFYLVSSDSKSNPLQSSKQGSVNNLALVDNTLPLMGVELGIGAIRLFSAIGLLLSLGALLVVGLSFYHATKLGQGSFIHMKYGSLIVDAYDKGLETLSPMIEVITIDDLAKIAERQNSMILHISRDFVHYYIVQNNGTTYRFVTSDGKKTEWPRAMNSKTSLGETL